MPEMSADVERPQVGVVTLGPEPTVTPVPPRATDTAAVTAPPNGSPIKSLVTPATTPADPAIDPPDTPRWRLATAGYLLLTAGFIFALAIPRLHVHAGLREEALVVLSIAVMLIATGMILASFVLNLLRQP